MKNFYIVNIYFMGNVQTFSSQAFFVQKIVRLKRVIVVQMMNITVLAIRVEGRGILILVSNCDWGHHWGHILCIRLVCSSKALMVYRCWKPGLAWCVEWSRSRMVPHNLG